MDNYNHKYYMNNKAKWQGYNAKYKGHWKCECCGCTVRILGKARHCRTAKHQKKIVGFEEERIKVIAMKELLKEQQAE